MRVGAGLEIYFAPFNDGVDEVLLWTIMGLAQSLRVGAEKTRSTIRSIYPLFELKGPENYYLLPP